MKKNHFYRHTLSLLILLCFECKADMIKINSNDTKGRPAYFESFSKKPHHKIHFGFSASEYPPSDPLKRSVDIEVPNADKGIEYQEDKIWEELGSYNEKTNSCVDHVCETLRQSGVDIKKSPLRQYKYLKDQGF